MKKFILSFRHLIVLTWLILILLIFKLVNNFVFENGSSIIFVILLIAVPIFVYTYTALHVRSTREKLSLIKSGYYNLIKKELNDNIESSHLYRGLCNLGLTVCISIEEYYSEVLKGGIKISISNQDRDIMNLIFTDNKCYLELLNTLIKINFYYSNMIDEFTEYDLRNFEYKDPNVLYNKIISKIENLINKEYIYSQSKKELLLVEKNTKEIYYQRKLHKIISRKIIKEKKEIKL